MKVDEWSSEDGHTPGGGKTSPSAGLTSNALPEAQSSVAAKSSQTGVSTRNALIVPDDQMDSLRIICSADSDNTIVSSVEVPKFEKGQLVRVIDGTFKGVIGRVARWQGQQRVAVVVDDLVTVITAYVPSAFLMKLK